MIFSIPNISKYNFCKYIFVNNFVNGVFDDFENIHVLKNKNIKILSIFYYHTQNKLVSPNQTSGLYMTTFISKKSNVIHCIKVTHNIDKKIT